MQHGRIAFVAALAVTLLFACDSSTSTDDGGTTADAGSGGHDGGSTTPDAGGGGTDAGSSSGPDGGPTLDGGGSAIHTVFVISMENHNWSEILGSSSAPYINGLLSRDDASYTDQYFNPPGIHPSEPNYIWMEAGDNFGIRNDSNPSSNHQSTTDHLVTQLETAGLDWRSYQEDIVADTCGLTGHALYAPKHNPMIYFDDVNDGLNPTSARCIEHVRPYTELATDISAGHVVDYNFITPNLCHDMHNSSGCATGDSIKNGDDWLSSELPMILTSDAYLNGGVVFITWDESEGGDHPIGMIVLSPSAKGHGYHNTIHYTHSSYLRTVEEIFGVPLLRDAQNAMDLSDLFSVFP